MKITEQKAETKEMIFNLLRTKEENGFQEVTRDNKTICVTYADIKGFLSFIVNRGGKTYAVIKESLSTEEREAELKLIFDDKLHYFTKSEVNKMNEILLCKRRKGFSFKSINYDDIKIIENESTIGEFMNVLKLSEELDLIQNTKDMEWSMNFKLLCMFKIGVIQGKREERMKKQRRQKESYF
ncbi:hypothetical protein [Clostridium felsineum]|uniref:Uncharacterized protein n=1 Tax=Clostridium felsineum TaxID=36839 RepID=A0A1S8L3F2_9CLOT|nr:hypothetical protein [Clostridium felsineum]URZ08944.1 hypothetical protein CLROS_043480 [Clostridium felsineum]URZ09572.1 hypothetical protein CROST_002530 [Clostridium felsineum]